MILQWAGFIFLLFIGFALFMSGLLNLFGCNDRTGSEFKISNIVQCLVGVAVFVGAFFLK